MNSVDWISLLVIAEFALLVSLALAALIIWGVRRRRRDASAAADLIAKVRLSEPERRAELEKQLQETGLPAAEAKQVMERLLSSEHRFYDQLIATYLNHDAEGVRRLDERLKAVLGPYLSLKRPEPPAAVEAAAPDRGDEVERLKQGVRNLSEEMGLYRETLNRVFSEYTAMFGMQLDPKQQLTAKEILDRLNSGELAGTAANQAGADGEQG